MATRQEILSSVREKYPEYADIPDAQLATGLASKYPEYAQDLASPDSASIGLSKSRQAGVFPEEKLTGLESAVGTLQNVVIPGKTIGTNLANLITGQAPSNIQRSAELQGGAQAGGALNTLTAGISDAIARRSGIPLKGREAVGSLAPISQSVGEIGGGFIPIGGATAPAAVGGTTLRQAAKEGATLGGLFGTEGGIAQVIENPDQSVIEKAGTIGGNALAGAIGGAVLNPLGVAALRRITPTGALNSAGLKDRIEKSVKEGTDILADLGKFPNSEPGRQARLLSGEYANVLPEISQNAGKEGVTTVPTFLDASQKALETRGETFRPIVQAADPALLENKADLLSRIEARLQKELPEDVSRQAAMAKIKSFVAQASPENLLDLSKQLNNDLINYYRSRTPEMAADLVAAKKAVRDEFAQVTRGILQDAGVDPKAYSGYGIITDLVDEIGDQFRQESVKAAKITGKPILERAIAETSTLTPGGLVRGAARTVAPELLGEPRRLDRQMKRLFKSVVPNIGEGIAPTSFAAMTPEQRAIAVSEAQATGKDIRTIQSLNDFLVQRQAEIDALRPLENQSKLAQAALPELLGGAAKTQVTLGKDLIKAPTDKLLEDVYHLRNTGEAVSEGLTNELERRLSLVKDKKNYPLIREALGIPEPLGEGMNLPTKRDLNVEEAIKKSLKKKK